MKVEIRIDPDCKEPTAVITAPALTDDVRRAADLLADPDSPDVLAGFRDGTARILRLADIRRVYASGGKVYAETKDGAYTLRMRLYEAEKRLAGSGFIRISHSEIVNLAEVERFDLSLSGTILVQLADGTTTYVSRRYVPKIRQVLGL